MGSPKKGIGDDGDALTDDDGVALKGTTTMSDEIKTTEGRVVGNWDGNSVEDLKQEIGRINQMLASEGKGERLTAKEMPHRDQLHPDLQNFNAYPLWGCDKEGSCLVGAGANRTESAEKVLSFSLVEHH